MMETNPRKERKTKGEQWKRKGNDERQTMKKYKKKKIEQQRKK